MSSYISIPERPANALSGSAFAQSIKDKRLTGRARDDAIVAEILRGNIPDFMRKLQPVELGPPTGPSIIIHVMPDYICIGPDGDFVRFPMGRDAAATIAVRFGATLPTTLMVDAIWKRAENKLDPNSKSHRLTMDYTGPMTSTDYFIVHDERIDASFRDAGGIPGKITAGHKKDIVLTPQLPKNSDNVAIYGWHDINGNRLQNNLNTTTHPASYADYSHGVRLVSQRVYVDGVERSIYDVLANARLSPYLMRENRGAPFPQAASLMAEYSGTGRDVLLAQAASPTPPTAAPPVVQSTAAPTPPAQAAAVIAKTPVNEGDQQSAAMPAGTPKKAPVVGTPPVETVTGPNSVEIPNLRARIEAGSLLKRGHTGDQVRELQTFLNKHGYLDADGKALEADSIFGPRTEHALRQFQQEQGIQVDGIVGTGTMGKVNMTNLMAGLDTNRDAMVSVKELRAQYANITIGIGATSTEVGGVTVQLNTRNPTLNRDPASSTLG